MRIEKLIVTHNGALKTKYGSRFAAIRKALATLVAADRTRGLTTKLVSLDDAAALRRVRGVPVARPSNERQTKAAIDARLELWDDIHRRLPAGGA